ncbi:polysaccharide pyruvyl transferase family protein [Salinibacterium sp. SWN1162]|uniref:polysaccharide pyruvyl transferase family protein n=1 Tax=Salinibacterium sp. SWN1162 TaxID=2792053 RepID=UPI0018CEF271|nr:polysaccharide pyruvyl transferase family protein [Salinibacterium sp. SWN1162]MBH0009613.1 polysaccharide pyruvyl transferase family protein [Salinibacterium sp. SWN1162]
MTKNPRRIVVLGTHGQYNIGDELLLATFLKQFGDANSYVVNTYDADDTAARIGDEYSVRMIDTAGGRLQLLRYLRGADALVFAGGSILKELSAATGRNRYSTLLMILGVVTFARWITRTPMAMLNIGVGPIRTRVGRRLAGLILAQVELVAVRDETSAALCARIGVRRPVISGADAVFSADPEWLLGGAASARADSRRAADSTLRVGLSLNHDIDAPEIWEHFLASLATALDGLADARPIEIHALPMQSRGKEHDDASVLRSFAERVPGITVIHHELNDHHDVANVISRCDVVVAERLHALITSAVLGVPIVPLAYDVKVRALATALGLDSATVDMASRVEPEHISAALAEVVGDLDASRRALAGNTQRLAAQANSGFDSARAWLAGAR